MQIKDMFLKDIDRDLDGVIKVGEKDENKLYQELDEYVVTEELSRHFRTFFSSYAKATRTPTSKMGVWISGFFGSGKSHLLKILSYLLENKEVKGKKALDFFVKDNKIYNTEIIKDIKATENIQGEVILFNIDSKSSDNTELLSVFVNVFNEARGYSPTIPYLADLEEYLDKNGKYEEFKNAFFAINGGKWEEKRSDFLFVDTDVASALVQIDVFSESDAAKKIEGLERNYVMSSDLFAKKINYYCMAKGEQYNLVFFVDEVGQYIGKNSSMMLKLQTLVEDLGAYCKGRVWVVVTSQQNIDDLTNIAGQAADDFSKIQGRFDTRLSLSSSNVDEVLKKRILEKKPEAAKQLAALYAEKEISIKNLYIFTAETPFQKLYADGAEFAETYPFVPYQFNLLQKSLTNIRKNSASGRSISSGARSMISMFKETASCNNENGCGNKEVGAMVPYDAFYEPMYNFIDAVHQQVIYNAGKNEHLNAFDVRVLKALFLVKYVKEFKANLDNIVTMLVDSLDADRIELKKKVADSLCNLENEILVQKNLDVYEFLTDQEQDINRSIKNERVDSQEISKFIADVVYSGILKNSSYKYSSRYIFRYNQFIDNKPLATKNNVIGINVLTPLALDQENFEYTPENLALQSIQDDRTMLIVLELQGQILDDVTTVLKIDKFTKRGTRTGNPVHDGIIQQKITERESVRKSVTGRIEDAVGESKIYIQGSLQTLRAGDPLSRLNEGLKNLVDAVFNKLTLMEGYAPNEEDIRKVLAYNSGHQLFVDDSLRKSNPAIEDMVAYISRQLNRDIVTLSKVKSYYSDAPYGFVEEDIYFLLAVLFKGNKVSLKLNSEILSAVNTDSKDIYKYLTQSTYRDKLVIESRIATKTEYIIAAKDVFKECFTVPVTAVEEDGIMKIMQDYIIDKIRYIYDHIYPHYASHNKYANYYRGKGAVDSYCHLLKNCLTYQETSGFFKYFFDNKASILDAYEDYTPVETFFDENTPRQYDLFNKACDQYKIYEKNEELLRDTEVAERGKAIGAIIHMEQPYGKIKDLQDLIESFRSAYVDFLETKAEPIKAEIKRQYEDVANYIEDAGIKEEIFARRYKSKYDDLLKCAEETHDLQELYACKAQGGEIKVSCIEDIKAHQSQAKEKAKREDNGQEQVPATPTAERPIKNLYISDIVTKGVVEIKNKDDIDKFIDGIRGKLEAVIKTGDTIKFYR